MRNKIILACLLFAFGWTAPPDPPEATISNKMVTAKLYLPDATNGYYQATRFDWAGLVADLEYNGHRFFEKWFDKYSPKIHDAVIGPVESFRPMGYDEAETGGRFIVIGVGALRKPADVGKEYNSFRLYDIIDGGKWTVKKKKDRVVFQQVLKDPTGYAYVYTKTLKLVKGKPLLVLEHSLKNTGSKKIETLVYNHNFPVIDGEPSGPGMKVIFPFEVKGEGKGFGTIAETRGNEILFTRNIQKNESVFSEGLEGFDNSPAGYDFKIENQKTGAGMHVTGDTPLEKLVFWASSTTICPEPYIRIAAAPGKEVTWNINYEFYTK